MKLIISKNEIVTSNDVMVALLVSIDIAKGRARNEMVRCAEEAKTDFAKFVQDIQKDVIDQGNANKVVINYFEEGGQEYVSLDLNSEYYVRYLQLLAKYAKPFGNIINHVIGLLMSFKAAFQNFGFITKGFEAEVKKLESAFSSKKD